MTELNVAIGYSNKCQLASFSRPTMYLLLYFQTSSPTPGHLNTMGSGLGAEQRSVPEHKEGTTDLHLWGFSHKPGQVLRLWKEWLVVCGGACLHGWASRQPHPRQQRREPYLGRRRIPRREPRPQYTAASPNVGTWGYPTPALQPTTSLEPKEAIK